MLTIETIWQPETQQKIFRKLLQAMSFPGEIINLQQELKNAPCQLGILATLLDRSVTWSDEDNLVNQRDRLLLQAQLTIIETANFIVKNAIFPPNNTFSPPLGNLENPEQGATLILVGKALEKGELKLKLSGAGIKETHQIYLEGFNIEWFIRRQQWVTHFPLGVDMILVTTNHLMALPRTNKITIID